MREESGSDKDAEEPEEWDDDGEASSDEDESDEEARVSNAQRGRVRLHGVSQSSAGLEVDDKALSRRSFFVEKWRGRQQGYRVRMRDEAAVTRRRRAVATRETNTRAHVRRCLK